jgi:hypothetical protein
MSERVNQQTILQLINMNYISTFAVEEFTGKTKASNDYENNKLSIYL